MKYHRVFILATLLLSGCSGFRPFQPSLASASPEIATTQDNISFLHDMMNSPQCTHACWLGIEPGMTNPTLVEEILKKLYGDENVVALQKDNAGRNIIKWSSGSSGIPSYIGAVSIQNNEVSSVEVYLGFEYYLTIENLVSDIGEPEFVLVLAPTTPEGVSRCYGVWSLFYPKVGLETLVVLNKIGGVLEKTNRAFKIIITKPMTQGDKNFQKKVRGFKMLPWHGFGNYCS